MSSVNAKIQITLVTVSEYCKERHIDEHTAYAMLKDGRLKKYQTPDGKTYVNLQEEPTFLRKR